MGDEVEFTQGQDWIYPWKRRCARVLFWEAVSSLPGLLPHALLDHFSYLNLCPFFCDLQVTTKSRNKRDASVSGLETYSSQDFLSQSQVLN